MDYHHIRHNNLAQNTYHNDLLFRIYFFRFSLKLRQSSQEQVQSSGKSASQVHSSSSSAQQPSATSQHGSCGLVIRKEVWIERCGYYT